MTVPGAIKPTHKAIRTYREALDAYNLHRGHWEAKDQGDDLTAEIRKKVGRGYPLTNTIFEDTARESRRLAVERARS